MVDWKNILSESEKSLTDEELLKYLMNDIGGAEKDTIEEKINNNAFEADAIHGLKRMQNKENLKKHVSYLNQKLQQITGKRQKKEKKQIKIWHWILLAVILLLFMCLISYFIIALQSSKPLHSHALSNNKTDLTTFLEFISLGT